MEASQQWNLQEFLDAHDRSTTRHFLVVSWLSLGLVAGGIVLASYLRLLHFPPGQALRWYTLALVLLAVPTALAVMDRTRYLVKYLAAVTLAATWWSGAAMVDGVSQIWGVWLIAPVLTITFFDLGTSLLAVLLSAIGVLVNTYLHPVGAPSQELATQVLVGNVALILVLGGAVAQVMIELRRYLQALKVAADDQQQLTRLGDLLVQVKQAADTVGETGHGLRGDSVEAGQQLKEHVHPHLLQMTTMATEVHAALHSSAEAMGHLQHAIEQVAGSTQNHAAHTSRASDAVQAMNSAVERVAGLTREVDGAARVTREATAAGDQRVQAVKAAIREMGESNQVAAEAIEELSRLSDQIGAVTTAVSTIAGQTNLLALNAAIEAARAGEAGRGFAVVAQEVRTLAERSRQSTGEIASLVERVQGAIASGARSVAEGQKRMQEVVQQVEETGTALHGIQSHAVSTVQSSEGIDRELQEVAVAVRALVETMMELNALSEETAAMAQEMSGAALEVAKSSALVEEKSSVSEHAVEATRRAVEQLGNIVSGVADKAAQLAGLAAEMAAMTRT